jgi:hypothetical protein
MNEDSDASELMIPEPAVEMSQIPKKAMVLLCMKCNHQWFGVYLPMTVANVARVLATICCPKCAATSKEIMVAP